jgi:hypothetical protein
MPASLEKVWLFFDNADAYNPFLHRVEAAIVEKALALRAETAPEPVTGAWAARQTWASRALSSPGQLQGVATAMLPALAVTANAAGLLSEEGTIDATDAQIRSTITDAFVDAHAGYTPEPA